MDSKNANALMALYENHEGEIRAAAIRWFGNNRDRCEQAIHNILIAIGQKTRTYDPQSMNASEWVSRVADAEARRLREALEAGGCRVRHTRRTM
jgi:DNA-directed RNA polymerase specialized sigma24 family protein